MMGKRLSKLTKATALIVTVLAFNSCKHTYFDQTLNTPADSTICFERDVLPIFTSNCARGGCHDESSHKSGYVFVDYPTIVSKGIKPGDALASKVFTVIADNEMPPLPNPILTKKQKQTIASWINAGAKNSTGCTSNCDSNNFTYSGAIAPLMTTNCIGCHSAGNASGNVELDSYNGVKTVAQDGSLYGAITHQSGYQPMPQGGAMLSDCEIAQVRKWIAAGTPNN